MEGMGMEEECTVCHVASASARCICCGSVVCNESEAFDGCAKVERTHFEAVAISKQLDHADRTESPSCTIFRGLRSPG